MIDLIIAYLANGYRCVPCWHYVRNKECSHTSHVFSPEKPRTVIPAGAVNHGGVTTQIQAFIEEMPF
jgi:hypothetical protein